MKRLILLALALVIVGPLRAQERTRSPHGDLKMECMTCHVSSGWTPIKISKSFNHAKFGFVLAGAHGATTCRACHQSLDFKGVRTDCASCHVDRHRGELGANCARCHTARSFLDRDVMTKAHQFTQFPLQGGHMGVDCADCHKPGAQGSLQFVGTPTQCISCHSTDFNNAPNHLAESFPTNCTQCHGQVAWARVGGLGGSHPSMPVALQGVHANRQCGDCHLAGQAYSAVQTTCDGCHHSDFVAAKDPDHVAAGFQVACNVCHGLVPGWAGATYAGHSTAPIDPKQGAHATVTCTQCHTKSPYSSAPTTCDGCHHADYLATNNPNHTSAGYTTECGSCHQIVAGWAGANANHPTSPIALTGVHANRLCADCHLAGQAFTAVQQTCDGCHHTDYVTAKDPDHVAAGFSTTCTTCHALVPGWTGATYAHAVSPIDPKQGAHGAVTCAQCHTTSPYSTVATTCDGCHHSDYVGTNNPSHTGAGFALTCSDCHQVVAGWTGATYASHPSTPLALTGPHAITVRACTDCHTTSPYSTVANTCDGCHHAVYIAQTDPNHQANGMSAFAAVNCATCHAPTKTAWTKPAWTHMTIVKPQSVKLPHQGASCADCHQNIADYTIKSCAKSGCHKNANGP